MYELIITEKPNSSKRIAEALSDTKPIKELSNGVPYYHLKRNNKDIVVACAVGHLYALAEKGKKTWTYPVFEIEWKPSSDISKKNSFSKKYLNVIKKLCKKADDVTIACDYDVEGEVIGLNVIRYACKKKDANRMKFSTLTKEDLVEAYENKMQHLDWGQANAGETRHFLDFYNGVSYSRALTSSIKSAGSFKIMSTGRVQGPALKIIVDREKEIKNFNPVKFSQLEIEGLSPKGNLKGIHIRECKMQILLEKNNVTIKEENYSQKRIFNVEEGAKNYFSALTENFKQANYKIISQNNAIIILVKNNEDKFWVKDKAEAIYAKIKDEKKAIIKNIEKKQFKQVPPFPFDLTTLQMEAYRCLRISPKETQNIAQELYTLGLISYPRTSSQQLPEKIGYRKIIQSLSAQEKFVQFTEILLKKPLKPNNGKKTDPAHPAIFPTGIKPEELKAGELKIYDLIVKRFFATFAEPAERETVSIKTDCKNEIFLSKGTRTIAKGWHLFYEPYVNFEEEELPLVNEKDIIDVKNVLKLDKETQPPKRFTPASIIKELERKGLGTKSTRSEIIETLFNRGYTTGKSITATNLGIKTIETLEKYTPKIIDEELTRHFEHEMESIREGTISSQKVLDDAKKAISNIAEDFKAHEADIGKELIAANIQTRHELTTLGKCNICNNGEQQIRKSKNGRFVSCTNYPSCKAIFNLPSTSLIKPAGKICDICSFPKVAAIKKGKRAQELCINPNCKSKFVEGEAGIKAKAVEKGEVIIKCPKCNDGSLVLRKSIYGSFYGCNRFPKCRHTEKIK